MNYPLIQHIIPKSYPSQAVVDKKYSLLLEQALQLMDIKKPLKHKALRVLSLLSLLF